MSKSTRKGLLLMTAVMAGVMTMTSAAYACVIYRGKMTVSVTANGSSTTVQGAGYAHAYCTGGEPTSAAGGQANARVTVDTDVATGSCSNYIHPTLGTQSNQLPPGVYEVRFNQGALVNGVSTWGAKSYTEGASSWTMTPGTGCFRAENAPTTKTIGHMVIGIDGKPVGGPQSFDLNADPAYPSQPGEAYNFCIGEAVGSEPGGPFGGRVGLLAPFRII